MKKDKKIKGLFFRIPDYGTTASACFGFAAALFLSGTK
jgi:hypothetical protein